MEPVDEQYDHLYYKRDLQKLRLVECWYKVKVKEKIYIMPGGKIINEQDMQNISEEQLMQMYLSGQIPIEQTITVDKVRVCSFFGGVLLEDIESPYEHGQIPFIPFVVFKFFDEDEPAGIVRDLKDPQREVNKRRSVATSDEVIRERLAKLPTVIEMPFNQIVRSYIERYTERGRAQVAALLGLSNYYMPIFEQAYFRFTDFSRYCAVKRSSEFIA